MSAALTEQRDVANVDEYIAAQREEVQETLETVRRTIRRAVPHAEEHISYHMPTYRYHGRLLYFAAFKKHFSIFAATPGVYQKFKKELSRYKGGARGTIQFPLDEPVPVKLIADIAKFRAKENVAAGKKR